MFFSSIGRRAGRGFVALAFVLAAGLSASPQTAYAKHGSGAGIALGILGGALAGAAIAGAAAPGYYAPPAAYYYPNAPQVYATPPTYYYAPPPTYYAPTPYFGPQYYYGAN